MDTSFSTLLESAKSILILLPTKPYFDQVSGGLSLYLSLMNLSSSENKKEITISCPSPMTVNVNRLVGVNKITTELGSKNLVLEFNGYDAGNIEKVSYDIENGQFKLTVVPKVGFNAPSEEHLKVSTSGVNADLIILIGGANESHFPALSTPDFDGIKTVHIGTRSLFGFENKGIISLARPASSTSELVASIIKENGLELDVDIATNLVLGIEEGSNHFESNEVTPETFETFAYLLRNGGRRMPKQRLTPRQFPEGSIPTKPFNLVNEQKEIPLPDPNEVPEAVEATNPPSDWLQPKVYKGGASVPSQNSYSENKG